MTREQAIRSIEVGIEMAQMLKQQGYEILCVGEMVLLTVINLV